MRKPTNTRVTQTAEEHGYAATDYSYLFDQNWYAIMDSVITIVNKDAGDCGVLIEGKGTWNGKTIRWRGCHTIPSSVQVRVGQQVKEGDKIGVMGDTGFSFGRHLHFYMYESGRRVADPDAWLEKAIKEEDVAKITKSELIQRTWRWAARVPHDIEVENWVGKLTKNQVVDKLKGRDTAKKAMHYLQNFEQVANERDVLKVDNAKLRVLNETKDKTIAELEGQLALVSEDTTNLNALGQALRWFLLRVGLKD